MESINFATYFRPKTFAEVVGQDIPKAVLKKIALASGISVRSIFLKGSYGSGKSTLCRLFGKAMSCSHFKELQDVCNECDSCKEVSSKNSQLYYEFDSSVVGNVDSIRSLQEQFAVIPNGRRVVVFDEIHSASKQALNAMLKMVEDGVPNTIFVFASTEDILPTLKSRSVCLEITPIPHELMKNRLLQIVEKQNIIISDNNLDQICIKSGGHMRDALSFLQLYSLVGEEGLKSSYQLMIKFFHAVFSKNLEKANQLISSILQYNMVDIKNSLYLFIRNSFISSAPEFKSFQSGLNNKIFGYFFNPVQQSALSDEIGMEILFRSFISKICK